MAKFRVLLVAALFVCALGGVCVLWVRHEAKEPAYTRFPLPNGSQQALLACAAGYARLNVTPEYPIAPIQEEAGEAAGVDGEFEPLATLASEGLVTARSQTDFRSFCASHHLWP